MALVFELLICFRTCDLAGIWSQEIAEVWNQEIAGIRGSRTDEALESWAREPTRSDLRNSGGHGWRIQESIGSQVKDIT
jgi:hypothetical protein